MVNTLSINITDLSLCLTHSCKLTKSFTVLQWYLEVGHWKPLRWAVLPHLWQVLTCGNLCLVLMWCSLFLFINLPLLGGDSTCSSFLLLLQLAYCCFIVIVASRALVGSNSQPLLCSLLCFMLGWILGFLNLCILSIDPFCVLEFCVIHFICWLVTSSTLAIVLLSQMLAPVHPWYTFSLVL